MAAGIDVDEGCRYAYEQNNRTPFVRRDLSTLGGAEVRAFFHSGEPSILVGCAACQPFSVYNQKNEDPKWQLVARFADIIDETRPDVVSLENVPSLKHFQGGQVFASFVQTLERAGCSVWHEVAYVPGYGVPQKRLRLVLLASLHGPIVLEPPCRKAEDFPTVFDPIGDLPPIEAGGEDRDDPLHRASKLSPTNYASIPGGSWSSWDAGLVAACHRVETGRGYRAVYGRMKYDEPAPTTTTQFYGFGNGRFGHPTQDSGLSLREGDNPFCSDTPSLIRAG